ncbi:hypothetical protein [Rhodohalobacter sulfatireducens]|uniref:Tetratricopeptide repeat protein n=1 Tax=Rhodohalobacter sulfatireducens TaxID=2911366 RepID=A0ABS9KGK1_9BACT|nr:hypothetical protein [Rhodohalobacter sulfatireducens]MCG2589975.1 hypothetical protein [Rhodohalobacter sulfatireducens]
MKKPSSILFLIISFLLYYQPLSAQQNLLGEINFPNSGSTAAQSDFIEGVLFLHNFEYEDAARAFRRAQETDPDFALAYWGEAMTHNHPIWMQQDRNEARRVLEKLGDSVEERQANAPTQREKDYLMTVELLYGNTSESEDKSKNERDFLYRDAMEDLHNTYPDDHEAAAFYGLSILGTAHEGRDYSIYMYAAGELLPIWTENQKHPGAAHYLIHSFDDPVHAPLGLPMARVYSEIAPAAAHAQHMTSHIFLALGMWEDVVDANIIARRVQTDRQKELNEKTTVCGHYPWWLQYGYLQKGEAGEAMDILRTCKERVEGEGSGDNLFGELWHYGVMMSHQIIDTENWESINEWKEDFSTETTAGRNYYFTSALAALKNNNISEATQFLEDLKSLNVSSMYNEDEELDIQIMQIESLLLIENGEHEEGLELLEKAVIAESELPVSFGPPTIVKPSYELLGDVLTELGRNNEAIDAYEKQLERTPERRRSLIGKEQARTLTLN